MKINAGAYWDVGTRSLNEDSVLLQIVHSRKRDTVLALVADGIGGLSEGHVASGYVCEVMNERFYREIVPLSDAGKSFGLLKRSLLRALYDIARELRAYADDRQLRLGSTAAILLITGRRYMCVNLGDCRVYECLGDRIKSINEIHSLSPGSVSRCVGSFPYMEPDVYCGHIRGRTGFLLASDGYYSLMDKDPYLFDPSKLRSDEIIEKRLYEIGSLIRKRGQQDNASAIYLSCV